MQLKDFVEEVQKLNVDDLPYADITSVQALHNMILIVAHDSGQQRERYLSIVNGKSFLG